MALESKTPRIRALYISPGHNFFGHHGQPPGEHPVLQVKQIECVAGRGIKGDRFFEFKHDYKGQITFFAWEIYASLCRELGLPNPNPGALRRNVLIEHLDLNTVIGQVFEIQGVRFSGVEECRPCYWMNGAVHPQAEAWLQGRGGLRARILSDGVLNHDAF